MFKRPFFLLGLLFGAFAAFRLRLFARRLPPALSSDFRDFITDALLICDGAGSVVDTNSAAQAVFGSSRFPSLRYLTGQLVPPGRHPLRQALVSRETISGLYGCTAADGSERVLDVVARPLPDGGAAAVFRDVTAQHETEARERAAQARQAVVQTLCRRLSAVQTAEAVAQAVAEEIHALLRAWPDVQVKLFLFDPASDTLTCLATTPDDRPKHPKSAAEARPRIVRFDAQIPELWQMYVTRKPSANGLPLITGGVAIGHLSVASAAADVLEDQAMRETLELIASLAALALAAPAASALAAACAAQTSALGEITAAVSRVGTHDLADKVAECVKRVTRAEICTLSVPIGGKLCVLGQAYKDDLLPNTAPDDPRLQSKASRKAWRTQKTVTHLGLPPAGEAGPWRAVGSAGCHSVTALPLTEHRGVLTVYTQGDKPLPDTQRKFLETVAALVSLSPPTATTREDHAD